MIVSVLYYEPSFNYVTNKFKEDDTLNTLLLKCTHTTGFIYEREREREREWEGEKERLPRCKRVNQWLVGCRQNT